MTTDYVFGYGSLINSASRARTASTGEALPVSVRGFARAWNFRVPQHHLTALGVVPRADAIIQGVLVGIESANLRSFDVRESGYERVPVATAVVSRLDGEIVPPGRIWTYVPTRTDVPDDECPIVQSYVDVVLSGCLEYGESFADDFVRTTALWDAVWIDDRAAPRYVRAMEHVPRAEDIDRILRRNGATERR